MELNLRVTSVIKIFLMPDSDSESAQSTFQGFLGEIIDDDYVTNLSKFSTFPQDALEIFMSSKEMVYSRNFNSTQNTYLLSPKAFIDFIPLFKNHPFVILACLPKDLGFILKIQNKFEFKPFIVSLSSEADINFEDIYDLFIFDSIFHERLKNYISNNECPEQFKYLIKNKKRRGSQLIDCGFISRMHGVTHATEAVMSGLGYMFSDSQPIPGSYDKAEYVNAVIKSATNLLNITSAEKDICKSDLIVYSPSMFSYLYRFNSNWWNQLLRPIKDKKIKEFIKKGIFKNPSYSGLTMKGENYFNPFEIPIAREVLMIRQFELALTVLSVQFLAVSNNAPAIRLPNSINYHSGEIKELEVLAKLHGKKRELNFRKKFKKLISEIKNEIGSDLIEFINKNSESLTLCTDVPLEWVYFDKIPLMFTHQISKIHTTPGNMLMSQASLPVNLTIYKDELLKVSVIRSFKDDDPLKYKLETSLSYFAKIDEVLDLSIVDVSNEDEFITAVNNSEGHILIIDCHGNHGGPDFNGWLQIGEDKLDTWKLRNKVRMPCIVILSACLTSAVSGSHASVANGILTSGALTVLGTLLPVNAEKSAIFVGRIIYRITGFLNGIEKLGVEHLTWREFMTGFLRMSYCTDILTEFRDNYNIINTEQYIKIHKFANQVINSYHSLWFDKVIDALAAESQKNEKELFELIEEIGITETMYYTQLGRPENIRIKLKK